MRCQWCLDSEGSKDLQRGNDSVSCEHCSGLGLQVPIFQELCYFWASLLGRTHGPNGPMDLVEEVLELSNVLSTKKIQQLLKAIADRVPHLFLPNLGCNLNIVMACVAPIADYQTATSQTRVLLRANLVDLASYQIDKNCYRNFIRWIERQKWRAALPQPRPRFSCSQMDFC